MGVKNCSLTEVTGSPVMASWTTYATTATIASLPLLISLACVRKASGWRVDGVECVSDSEARLHVLDREGAHAADDVEGVEAVVARDPVFGRDLSLRVFGLRIQKR
jgi:hypothetical protein